MTADQRLPTADCRLPTKWRARFGLWLGVCAASAIVFFRDFWGGLPQALAAEGLRRNGVYGWGMLAVCLFWLFLKREAILARMRERRASPRHVLLGLGLTGLVLLLPANGPFAQAFKMLVAWLGVFTLFFGEAAFFPAIALGVYGFSLAFPVLTRPLAEGAWGEATRRLVVGLSPVFGVSLENGGTPVSSTGQTMVAVAGPGGEPISALVTYECAGQITMGIFLALFVLMMLDVAVPVKKAVALLLFGITGTAFQNLVRIEAILLAAQWWGWAGLRAAHQYVPYAVFPLWYAVFALVYFRVARRVA